MQNDKNSKNSPCILNSNRKAKKIKAKCKRMIKDFLYVNEINYFVMRNIIQYKYI